MFIPMNEDVEVPQYETNGSSGMDVRAYLLTDIEMYPRDIKVIATGLECKIPKGYELQVRPRSGLAFKHGVTVLNSPGTIDSDYVDCEIKICLINHGGEVFKVKNGDRIAQFVYAKVARPKKVKVSSKVREGGMGHTGVE